jgi:hypothetical protein
MQIQSTTVSRLDFFISCFSISKKRHEKDEKECSKPVAETAYVFTTNYWKSYIRN